jgi:transposase
MSPTSIANIKNIDHLGIVAGLIDEIGIVETINSKLGIDSREKISSGILVKAILLNGLGFVSRPLYLFSQFFEDKGIEILLEPSEILTTYKNQQSCERGFRFLKDPLFFADSFFVENPVVNSIKLSACINV